MTDDSAAKIDEHVKREARDWVLRLSSGAVTAADAMALNSWRATSRAHRQAFAEANRLWNMATQSAIEVIAEGAPAAWAHPASHPRAGLDRRFFLGGALAASAAGAAYLAIRPPLHMWPAVAEFVADVRTNTGQQRNVVIDGGAAIELNTNTSMNFPPTTGGADRIELIAGEVAITTSAVGSRPMVVLAADGRSVTSGAQFNVRYDSTEVQVTCLDGTVQVDCGGGSVMLRQRQQVSYGEGRLGRLGRIAEIDPEVITAWREGLLVFRNDPLQRVIDEVNRYRPGKIIVMNEELGRKLVFASFRLDRLDEVVTRVANVFGAQVRTFPAGIVMLS
jgi:transmembrane sensor